MDTEKENEKAPVPDYDLFRNRLVIARIAGVASILSLVRIILGAQVANASTIMTGIACAITFTVAHASLRLAVLGGLEAADQAVRALALRPLIVLLFVPTSFLKKRLGKNA